MNPTQIPASTIAQGWPAAVAGTDGRVFMLVRDGYPAPEPGLPGDSCLYCAALGTNKLSTEGLFTPAAGVTEQPVRFNRGAFMYPEQLEEAGVPKTTLPLGWEWA